MRNLRRVFRQASLLGSANRRRESARGSRNDSTLRRLSSEALEKRELLAGDLGTAANHNYWNAYDVNDDHQISALDALGVINYLGQSGEGELIAGDGAKMFYDVNADNRISASDALGVINALGRGEEVGEIVELVLTARTANDELIAPDANGEINVNVGERFDLEVAYDDLRVNQFLQPDVELGVFQLFTDVAVSQPGVLMPILNETQRLIIDSALRNEFANSNINQFQFTIPESPPGRSGQLSFTAPLSDFPTDAITNALTAFGYEEDEFEIETLDFGNGPDDDLGYQIHWVGEEFGNVDLPNVSLEVILFDQSTSVDTETIEFAPFLADGETPNPDAVRFNINAYSRTYPDQNNPSGTLLYTEGSRGSFDSATGFDEVGGFSREVPITGGGIPEIVGSFEQPFDAFSLPVYLKSEVSDFVVSVNPGEDPEAMLVFGRDDAVPQDFILVETVDSNNNGISQVVLNATVNAPGIIGFDPTSISVDEDAGVASLTVTRTSGSVGAVTVNYSAVSGTASGGSDFAVSAGFLEFADGETTQTLNISILNDTIIEGNEQFTVVLSDATGGASVDTGTATATVTIVDDEVAVPGEFNLNLASASIDENDQTGSLTLAVNRDGGSDGIVSVKYTVAGVTATPGSDYTDTSDTLVFQDGDAAKNIVVPILDDTIFEGNETFTVTLSDPTGGATVGTTNQTVVTIVENEVFTPGVFSLESATAEIVEADSGGNAGKLTLTVNREGGTDGEVTVDFTTVASGDATANVDFTTTSGTLTFDDGQASKTIEVDILDDSLIDPDETFSVVISNPGGGAILSTIKPTTTVVTIVDDENPGTLAFTSSIEEVNEDAGTVTLTVFRDGGTDGVVTVVYATSGGTATEDQDYTGQTGALTFADGVDSQSITVDITDDIFIESNETFVVTLSSITGGAQLGSPASVTVTIVEDDVPGELAFSTDTATVSEDGGFITLTVTRTNGNDGVVTVNYQTVDGTGANGAVAGTDYESTSGTLTFGNGVESETITVPITNNTTINPDKVFSVELSGVGGGASIGTPDTVNVTILEDDIELLFNPAAYTVGETVGTASLTVTRIGDTDQEVSVAYETTGITAVPAEDFDQTTGTVTFAVGETSKTIDIPIVDDNQQEEDETFIVTLDSNSTTGGATLGATPVATVTIDSEDVAGLLSIQNTTVDEDEGTVTLTVSRTNGTDGVISVDYQTVDGTAIAGEDYLSESGTLTFAHEDTAKQITISIIHDLLGNEGNETFTVELDNATGGAAIIASQAVAEVTIVNVNEAPTATPITIPDAGETLSEEDSDFTISESDLLAVVTDRETDNVLSISNIRVTNGDGQGISVDGNLNSLAVSPSAYGYLTGSQSAVIELEYDISDGTNTITNTVTITIAGFNDAPIAVDDLNAIAFKGATSNIHVLDNDDAGDGEDQGLEIISAASPDGDVVIKNDGTLDFTPVADFTGPTTITYKIRDAEGKESDFATVFVEVKEFLPSSVTGFVFIDEVENSASDIAAGADPIRNGVKDSDEQGLMGALVSVFSAATDNVTGELVEDTTLTDSDGSFSFGNLAPGTYAITYQSTDGVLFTGQPTRTLEIPVQGGVDATGFDFALLSLAGQVDILASAYYYRDGGVVSLDDTGVQEFVTSLDGYAEDVKFVEFALSSTRDTALLTIVEDDKEVKTAQLSSRDFRLFGDAAFFFKGQDELSFLDEGEISGLAADYPSYRDAVDQVLADM